MEPVLIIPFARKPGGPVVRPIQPVPDGWTEERLLICAEGADAHRIPACSKGKLRIYKEEVPNSKRVEVEINCWNQGYVYTEGHCFPGIFMFLADQLELAGLFNKGVNVYWMEICYE